MIEEVGVFDVQIDLQAVGSMPKRDGLADFCQIPADCAFADSESFRFDGEFDALHTENSGCDVEYPFDLVFAFSIGHGDILDERLSLYCRVRFLKFRKDELSYFCDMINNKKY